MLHEIVHGHRMPSLGLGTLRNDGERCTSLVEAALAEGYRHIDTGRYYGNEEAVGRGLARSSVPRDEVWVTTKLLHPKTPPMTDVAAELDESLRRLRTDHVDQLLIHWPNPEVSLEWALGELAALRAAGKARTIGVSNFPTALVERARATVDDLAANQVEYHPYLAQRAVLEQARAAGMVLTAHSPLVRGELVDDPVLGDIGRGHGVGPTQVALAWLVAQDRVAAIPGAGSVEHLRDNLAACSLELSDDERTIVSGLARGRRVVDPPHGPEWDLEEA